MTFYVCWHRRGALRLRQYGGMDGNKTVENVIVGVESRARASLHKVE